MAPNQKHADYHVLVAIGAQSQLGPLFAVGRALAAARHGRVTILSVTPSGERPGWLTIPDEPDTVPVEVTVRTGNDPGAEILSAAREEPPELILLGWRGDRGRGQYLLGRTLDPVVQHAACDVAIIRAEGSKETLGASLAEIRQVLVPTHGGPNATLATDLALALSPETHVTALYVAHESQGQVALSLGRQRLDEILEPWGDEPRVTGKVIAASSPIRGILAEAAKEYDLVMVGASHESYLDRMLFGNVPQTVAARSPSPSIVVKRHTPRVRVGTWLRLFGWRVYDMLPTLDLHEQIEVYKAIREGAQPNVDFFVMIGLSAAIATLGLLLNSPAVIIGAMLVAPLMAAIFGLSLGLVRGDSRMLRRAASATLRGMALAISVGLLLTLLLRTLIGPEASLPGEILSRTQPSLLDLGVALASGAAGAYALCRKDVSASLPGVAIAAALVPPLAVVGIGLARWDGRVAGGALLLFITNLVAITVAGGLVFLWLGFRPIPGQQERSLVFRGGMLGTALLLIAVTILLATLTIQALSTAALNRAVTSALETEIGQMESVELAEWEMLRGEDDDQTIRLHVWVRSSRQVRHQEVVDLQENLAGNLQRPVELELSVIPTTRLDPREPPTPTPTPPPGATATPTPTSSPTSTPRPTATPTASPTPTATATATATATDTPTPTATPTDMPSPTPTPTPMRAVIGGTGGQGVWMYRQPKLQGGKITAWRDGTQMILTGEQFEADGYLWIQVVDPKGRLGWIPEDYMIYLGFSPQ